MIAFDTDVLTGILLGNISLVEQASAIPAHRQVVPIIVIEEILRGRLNVIRQAEAGKSKVSIDRAYALFEETFVRLRQVRTISYTSEAESLYQQWRKAKIGISTHDLRIAALCVVSSAKLISRNRRDYVQVPGLDVELWT